MNGSSVTVADDSQPAPAQARMQKAIAIHDNQVTKKQRENSAHNVRGKLSNTCMNVHTYAYDIHTYIHICLTYIYVSDLLTYIHTYLHICLTYIYV